MANSLISKMVYLGVSRKHDAPFICKLFAGHSADEIDEKLAKSTAINWFQIC